MKSDTDGDGTLDGDEIFKIKKTFLNSDIDPNIVPSLEIEFSGELLGTLHISKTEEDDLFLPKEMPGYLGAGYDFSLGGELNKVGTLTYKFNSEFLKRKDFNPAIYHFDGQNQELILLENQNVDLVNCTVSAPITEMSEYILLDKTEFDKAFEVEVEYSSYPDTDGDGLSDYIEESLRLFNGIIVKTDPKNPDTDGDGLLDGEEVSVVLDKKNNIDCYKIYSWPTSRDTDGDGYID